MKAIEKITEQWISGCYGLKYPAVIACADGLVFRKNKGRIEILIGTRGPGRWEAGLSMTAFGGFVDPGDPSPRHTVIRELQEEVPGINAHVWPNPFFVGGPIKYVHCWNPKIRKAIQTNELAQNIPTITMNYLAEWEKGSPKSSEEVLNPKWVDLEGLMNTKMTYAFDQALVLERAIEEFKKCGLC